VTNHTRYLHHKPAQNAFRARRYAEDGGMNFNLLVTINWKLLSISSFRSTQEFNSLRAKVARAWKYKLSKDLSSPEPMVFIVYHENPNGVPNTHWLMSLPDNSVEWVEEKVRAISTKLYGRHLHENAFHFERNIYAVGQLQKYLSKGMSPATSAKYHVKPVDQGIVYGRRVSMSRSIGRSSRKKTNWRP